MNSDKKQCYPYILIFADCLKHNSVIDSVSAALGIFNDNDLQASAYYVFGHTDFLFILSTIHFEKINELYPTMKDFYIKSIEYIVSPISLNKAAPLSVFFSGHNVSAAPPFHRFISFGGNYTYLLNVADLMHHFSDMPRASILQMTKRIFALPISVPDAQHETMSTTPPIKLIVTLTSSDWNLPEISEIVKQYFPESATAIYYSDNNDLMLMLDVKLNYISLKQWALLAVELLDKGISLSSHIFIPEVGK